LMVVFWGIIVTICKCGIHHELDVKWCKHVAIQINANKYDWTILC
jgi:hypothetical protein